IGFRCEIPYPRNGSALDRTTIEALQLDREIIHERRREHRKTVEGLVGALKACRSLDRPKECRVIERLLVDSVADYAQYASMVQCAALDNGWNEIIGIYHTYQRGSAQVEKMYGQVDAMDKEEDRHGGLSYDRISRGRHKT
ncbi:MAG: hypothetical protein ACLQVD_03820, partial [Capsulimonadaceae bacterium]